VCMCSIYAAAVCIAVAMYVAWEIF